MLRGDDRVTNAVDAAPGFVRVHDTPLGHLLRLLESLTAKGQVILLLYIGVLHLLDHLLIFPKVADEVLQALGFVLLVLAEQLLLIYQVVLISPEPLNLMIELLELMCLLLLLHCDLIGLLRPRLLQLGQVRHQPVVLLLMKLQLLLLRLRRPLLLLKLHSILMHGITIEELFIAPEADGSSALPSWIVQRIWPRLRQACGTVQCPAETAT